MNSTSSSWQHALANAFTDVDSLCQYLKIQPEQLSVLRNFPTFPLKVPLEFAALMEIGNPEDPLLRQVLPIQPELEDHQGFVADPVGDLPAVANDGVIHKYQARVLLITTGACAINCRYCFRRNFPYSDLQLSSRKTQQAIDYITANPEITEVILSGGDPLLLSDDKLNALLQTLNTIPHLQRIRIHSRIPVVLPSRITPSLLALLKNSRCPVLMVLHCNHAREISSQLAEACKQLRQHGIVLLNQSVLLKGVNDNAHVLCELSEQLFTLGVMPYYLHQLDKAKGVAHFEVDDQTALDLYEIIKRRLPGYLVPKLVREKAGAPYKLNLY